MTDSQWNIRLAKGSDLPFIYATWVDSFRYDSHLGKSCRNQIFFREYNLIVDRILTHPDTKVHVAQKPDDTEVIYGYLVSQAKIFHYAFVKQAFRKWGIAKSLFYEAGGETNSVFTHRTFEFDPIFKKHANLIYNPFTLPYQPKENA
jgi:hypothetical protein